MRSRRRAEEGGGEIDLTPMLDVVFIMLIFFIVTASFVKEAGIDVNRPLAETAQAKKHGTILIAVNAQNEIWMDKQQVDPRSLKARIEAMRQENPKGTVVVQADGQSNAKTFALVVDAAKSAGIKDIALSTEQK